MKRLGELNVPVTMWRFLGHVGEVEAVERRGEEAAAQDVLGSCIARFAFGC